MKLDVNESYEIPAIVYEGKISTRAGSPTRSGGTDSANPDDLFNN